MQPSRICISTETQLRFLLCIMTCGRLLGVARGCRPRVLACRQRPRKADAKPSIACHSKPQGFLDYEKHIDTQEVLEWRERPGDEKQRSQIKGKQRAKRIAKKQAAERDAVHTENRLAKVSMSLGDGCCCLLRRSALMTVHSILLAGLERPRQPTWSSSHPYQLTLAHTCR